jgi:uncharacterized protein YhjY with autotransporter beta-barrel domain
MVSLSEGRRRAAPASLAVLCLLLAAPLAVFAQAPPTVAQISFAPASIQSGATSQLTVAFGNSNAGAATLTNSLTDSLPVGLTLANGTVTGSCSTGSVSAASGGSSFTYAAGATIPGGGCTITVTVKGTTASASTYYTDSIPAGALQTNLGNNPAGVSGTLQVRSTATVPKLTGLTQAAAASALQAAGLVLGAVQQGSGPPGTPFNTIYSQSPAAGSAIASGSSVSITVSTGNASNPNAPLTSVPGYVDPSQQSVAGALERLCAELQTPGLPLSAVQKNLLANCLSILNTYGGGTDANGLRNTLNAVSGKQATAQQRSGVQFAGTQFVNIGARLAQLRQGTSGVSLAGLDTGVPLQGDWNQLLAAIKDGPSDNHASPRRTAGGNGGDPTSTGDGQSRWGFFINGSLRRGTQDTTSAETGFDFKSNGVSAGADYRFTDHIVAGLALGHSNGNTEFTDGSGRLDSRGNSGSLYATYYNDAWYVDVIGTYGHVSYDADRNTSFSIDPTTVPIPPTNCVGTMCEIHALGSTGAKQLAFGASSGYSFHFGGLDVGPDVALDYTYLKVNGFSESDPNQSGMQLAFGEQLGESLLLKAGGHVSYAISTPIAVILPQLNARYIHEFKNDARALQAYFLEDPGVHLPTGPVSNFQVYTDQPDRGYFDYTGGITAQFAFGIAAFVNYSAIAGETNIRTHEVSFGIRFQHLVF